MSSFHLHCGSGLKGADKTFVDKRHERGNTGYLSMEESREAKREIGHERGTKTVLERERSSREPAPEEEETRIMRKSPDVSSVYISFL